MRVWPAQGRVWGTVTSSICRPQYSSCAAPTLYTAPGSATPDALVLRVQEEPCSSLPPLQVPEIIQFIYHNMSSITEDTAQATIKKILHLLAQTYTDEVILTLFKMEDHSQR